MKKNLLFSIIKYTFLLSILLSSVNLIAESFATDYFINKNTGVIHYSPSKSIIRTGEYFTFKDSNNDMLNSITVAVATPALSLAPGTYSSTQSLTITCSTSGTTIRYTTDNTDPAKNKGTIYTGPINISASTTIKAIAYIGSTVSSIASGTYTIAPILATPTFSPSPGSSTSVQNITISATTGATIRYTTDGTTPNLSSPIFSSTIPISVPTTINAIAVMAGYTNSVVAVGTYNVLLPVSAPTFSVAGNTYNSTQYVTISSTTVGASIYYTTDGTDPTTSSTLYNSSSITIDVSRTLKAIAVKNQMGNSPISSVSYIIKCANPTFSPVAATYSTFQTVSLSSITSGTTIRYTTDGSTPSATVGTIYSAPIAVNATTLINAIAYKSGATNSDVASGNFNIQLVKVSSPVLSVAQGTYNTFQTVGITCPTPGSTIMYTTDGTDASPTNGTVYTAPIAVNASTVIKTMAFVYGMANSDLITGSYVIQLLPVDAPVFNPQAGAYEDQLTVTIATTTTGSKIHFTTDGSVPTETAGDEYTAPITIATNTNFKAIAFKQGMNDSPVSTSSCIIKVAKPVFSPVAGNYSTFQSVTLSTTTSGATIRYTTDGSTPSHTNGTVYSGAIAVNASTTINAIAYLSGKTDSDIATGIYNITLIKVATPTFTPVSGTYNTFQSIALSSTTSGATIRYTTDGSTPSQTNGTVYSTSIPIQSTTNLKAIAYKFGMTDSDVGASLYTIQLLTVATPTFSVAPGTYNASQSVTITTTTTGASIYYTTDGSTPTASSTLYTAAVNVTANTTLNAIAIKSGMNNSLAASAVYVINCATPVLSPASGTYNSVQTVTMSTTTSGATIYYTTDGTTIPTVASAQYSAPLSVGVNATLKAVAIKTGMGNSTVATETYTILLPVTAPTFSPIAGTYNASQSVTIASTTSGASIRYTTDGSTPSDVTGTAYTAPITISANTTLKAVAYKTGMSNSPVISGDYVINCATPVLNPATGTYTSIQSVSITSTTPGASIYYTTDGSAPTTSSSLYSSAISVGVNMTIKAIAIKAGMGNSGVGSESYTILLPCAAPTFTAPAGTYTSVQSITIASTTSGADIYYTLDGTDPTTSSPHYTGTVSVGSTLTLKAIAVKSGMSNSPVTSGLYTILLPAAAPQFSPLAGTYTTTQSVSISSTTTGGDTKIYYTTNGTDPTTSSTLYSAPVSVAANTTLKAITVKTGMSNSPVSSAVYAIKCATPAFSPVAGSYSTFQSISLSSATSGATIRYTTDGSTPSQTNGTIYSTAIAVNATTTIRAIAYQSGMTDSDIGIGAYTITLVKVATPTLSVATGTYNNFQNVTLACSTSGATIRYTTDGSNPSQTNGTVYSAAIPIQSTTTLKVIAYKYSMTDSDVASAVYTIQLLDAAAPTFSPAAGTYNAAQSVTITSATSGASIYYTTDGTTPTTSSTPYTGAVSVSANTTLKAFAVKTEMNNSAVSSASYIVNCASPVLSPAGATYTTVQTVSMSTSTTGASIYYTSDGSAPSASSTLYGGPVSVGVNTTLKAIAILNGMGNSPVASETYTILLPTNAPTFSPAAGTYNSSQSVTIATTTSGASIRYTTDGSTPSDVAGTVYTVPVTITANTTLKAITYKSGMSNSTVTSGAYVINCAVPLLSVATGSYNSVQSVSITSTTSGALIYYTTDGSTPTPTSTLYGGAISVGTNMTIKAIAVKSGMGNSGVGSETYTILLPTAAPTFSPVAGTYNTAQNITISTTTSGASIYYTTDGGTPTSSSTLYTGTVNIAANTTLNAITIKSGMSNSTVSTAGYVINCATPVLSPVGATYPSFQSVTMTTSTSGASIYFTTDGSTPTSASTLYTGAISVGVNTTIKAIAIKNGMGNSAIASEVYVISLPITAPTFTPSAGTYNSAQNVSITSSISGASINYTLDGSDPSETSGTAYTIPLVISANTTLKAIAFKSGFTTSPITTGGYIINCATPVLSPVTGSYTSIQSVTISSTTAGASIYYTTDGTTPTASSTPYSSAVSVGVNTTIKAIAIKTGMGNSAIATETYTILLPCAAPTFSIAPATYNAAQSVIISSTTPGVSIYYTTDGSTPTTSSNLYSSAVSVAVNTTLNAIAVKNGMSNSTVSSASYVINCATPVLSPAGATYTSVQSVSMSSSTSGASIYYTTDGTTPSVSGTLYSAPVTVGANVTLKAIAIMTGMGNSPVASESYVILLPASEPTYTPVPGTYNTAQSVTIASSISGASIRYTTNGTTPSDVSGTLYTTPVTISANTTLKAVAYKTGMSNSPVTSGDYVINCALPVLSVASGTYNTVQSVTITSATTGATIYYTTDGTVPTTSSTQYSVALSVGANMTIKAIAVKTGMGNSGTASESYIILLPGAAPTFTPAAGTYTSIQSVTIASTTSGADIYYTLDGNDPTTSSPHYTGPVSVGSTLTLKAIAVKSGMSNSPVTTGLYTILLPAAAPQFSPEAGTFAATQNVSITSATTGGDARIYYTTNGSDPTTSSTLYSSPVSVSANTTLKAITVKTGMSNSPVSQGSYAIKCGTPTFSVTPGTFSTFQSITLSTTTSGATIKYTTDGSQPSPTNGTVYTTAIAVNATTTIRAIAFQTGMTDSDIATGIYTISLLKVATPVFSPASGIYNTFQSVTLSCATSGATIKYTTDGSTPGQNNGTTYTTAIPVQQTSNLKAIAFKTEMTDSDIATAAYTIQLLDVAAPAFSPVGATYDSPQSVSITSATSGASVYYTTDGSTPTVSSTLYSGTAISVSANTTLKAIAVKAEMNNSTTSTSAYVINCAIPVHTPAGGTYNTVQNVTMATGTAGASIYYTTDGSVPTVSGTLYTPGSTITVGANVTLKAIAVKTNMGNSSVASQDYVILIPVTAPSFTPSAGTYNSTQSVTINSTVDGASIRYTTDGTTPTETVGTLYTAPVSISANTVLKAIAYKAGMSNSPVTTGSYTINCVAPQFSVASGNYTTVQSLTLTSTTPGAAIYYTTNGDVPSSSATRYTGAISVEANMTVKAITTASGMGNSSVTSETYIILLPVVAPTFAPVAGSYTSVQTVTIASTTTGADFYYTLDGTTPTTSSPHYTGPVSVASNLTMKAIATKTGMSNSPVTSGDYVILLPTSAPQFSPIPGSYTSAQNVIITSTTTGGDTKIYYTLDGTDPTTSSTLYNGQIPVTANVTIKAITTKTGMSNSPVTTGSYVIYPKASDPTFLPAAGTYIGTQNVTIATTSVGAKIHYTTDGSNPTETVGTEYTGPVTIAVNTNVKAIAYGTTFSKSNIASVIYNIKVATPILSLLPGTYSLPQTLTISCTTADAKIYFTTDGTTPSATNGTLYTTPVTIGLNNTTVQVIAIKTGMADSDPVTAAYTVNLGKAVKPVFTPAQGTYVGTQQVTITSETSGATIKYTLDGTAPGPANGTVYTSPVAISANGTLKAIASKTNMVDSDIASGDYKIKPEAITFTPLPGNYTTVQSVVLACATPGVTIKYTLDESAPSKTNGITYTAPITLSSNLTLQAIAYKTGMEDGDIAMGDYTFQLTRVVKPVFTPAPGNYTTPQAVSLTTTTTGATIRYTTDGTAPSKTVGKVYTTPILISANTTINAIAYKTGLDDSEVVSGDYTIVLGSADYDGDGVSDNEDNYPTDPKLAFDNYYPGVGFGSVAFEDNWPFKADYDMNDMVVDYRFNQITNADNMVVKLTAKLVVRAMGASFHNGFGIEFPVTSDQITSCVVKLKNGNPVPMGSLVSIDPVTGLEKNQAKAVVILFDDGFNILASNGGTGVNTSPTLPFVIPDTLMMTVTFAQPVSPDVLKSQIFNPFIFTNMNRGYEVHLPDFPPTSLANKALFNTGEDKSDPASGKYYKTATNLPWALNIYEGYQYPNEKVSILDAYKHFGEWANSGGTLFPDWFKDLEGYRNASNIYSRK